ncbi:MAG TPA: phosphatase domain-containing protein [Bacteriovoracaceae bacterium]|nr:phosphatase domain-containing protein [Bacteriovoracaceae bacterium]
MKWMSFFLLFSAANSFAGVSIISDLDDTIKITNAGNTLMASYNGILKTKVFTAMPTFLAESRSYTDELTILSTSPFLIRPMVLRNFSEHDIDVDDVILKTKLLKNSHSFKVGKIREVLSRSNDDFILLGDDVNADVEVFDTIIKQFPKRILVAYVHVVKGKKLPASVTPYFTAADLAMRENLAGRMGPEGVMRVAEQVLEEPKMDRIFPGFAQCPRDPQGWNWVAASSWKPVSDQMVAKINKYCGQRATQK